MTLGRPARRDVLIAAAVAAVFVLEVGVSRSAHGPFLSDAAFYGAAAACLAWRRIHPISAGVGVLLFALAASALGTGVTHVAAALVLLVLPAYAVGHESPGRRALAGIALFAGLMVVDTMVADGHFKVDDVGFPAGIQIASFAIGRLLRTRAQITRTLADEEARIELDRERRAQAAVGAERTRIAREMHDVIAHTMAIMVVQAGAARSVLARDPEAAVRSLETVEETGRLALAELRRMLGFLREDAAAQLAPQPTLDELDGLIARAREAGLPVDLHVEGEPYELDGGAELAAYRIVQEALTNTLKHAGAGARARVSLRWAPDGLELAIVDDGGAGTDVGGSGQGLVGMRERVAMLGGELTAQPRPDGGFAVRARIPRTEVAVA